MRFNRSINIFEEWLAGAWVPKVIGLAGGGTGGTTPAEIITSLGLGSMATQNSNAVNITGGTITGVNFSANDITSGIIALARGGTGASLSLGAAGTVLLSNGTGVVFAPGTSITQLNASNLTTGTVPAARLSGVGLLASNNTWTGINTFAAESVTISGANPGFLLIGSSGAANKHRLNFFNYLGDFYVQAQNDDGSFAANILHITNAGVINGIGSGLSNLNASNLASGMVPQARMGVGGYDSTTFLRGDGWWAVPPGSGGSTIPSGLIAIFESGCPSGWSRVASLDNRFPMGSTGFGGTGGNTQHRHGVGGNTSSIGSHAHSFNGQGNGYGKARGDIEIVTKNANGDTFTYDGGGSSRQTIGTHYHDIDHYQELDVEVQHVDVDGNTSSEPGHSHSFSVNSDYADHYPPYIGVIWCRKD
jgi:hypothetical protein